MAQATLSDVTQEPSDMQQAIDWLVLDSVATAYLRMDDHYAEFEEYDSIKRSEVAL